MANIPWYLRPKDLTAEALYPHLTEKGKEKAAKEAKLRRKRGQPEPDQARGFVSPLQGVAVPSPQPKKRK